jgi:hypothetical protein
MKTWNQKTKGVGFYIEGGGVVCRKNVWEKVKEVGDVGAKHSKERAGGTPKLQRGVAG